jgi:DNA-binding SARP family transcriptional activator
LRGGAWRGEDALVATIPEQDAPANGESSARARVALCGELVVELDGTRVESDLPGRQGRLMLAFLVANRDRSVTRDELVELLWPDAPPAVPDRSLRPLLTRLRKALGEDRLVGRPPQICLDLGPGAWVDVDVAAAAAGRAEAALGAGDAPGALRIAEEALRIVERPFLPEALNAWAEERRKELQALEAPLLEAAGRAAAELGPGHRALAERLARRLVEREPYRETGVALLMEVLAAQGNVVEALRAFDELRARLDVELGLTPAPAVIALHDRLLRQESAAAAPATARPELPQTLAAVAEGPFVGRSEPLRRLEEAFARAVAGSEQMLFVHGEPGVGKTRLVSHFAAARHAEGATVLYGRCDEEALMPFQPAVEALSHAVRHGARLGLPAELAAELRRLVPQIEDAAPASALQEPLAGERDSRRFRLFQAVATALGTLAGERGLVLVLDDLHWADRATLRLVRFLARIGGGSRVLLLGTYRDDAVGPAHPLTELLADLHRERRFERVALAGLDEPETAALVAASLPADASPGFVRRLCEHTSGNPFFIEETLRGIAADDGGLDEEQLATGVPERVGDVIVRRLGTVDDDVREVLGVAAVAGSEFDLDVVAAALQRSDEDVLSAIERAMDARLVDEAGDEVDRFTFCHALVRETLYRRQATSRRLRRHLRVAEALERPGRRRRPPAAELARHFLEARALAAPDRTLAHVLAAADEAVEALAYDEAVGHLEQALELIDELGEADGDALRSETLLSLGRVLWRAGDPVARRRFAEAAEVARRAGCREAFARAVLGMTGRFYEAGVADPHTIALVEEALAGLGEDDSSLRARLLARLSDSLHVSGEEDRRARVSEESVAMARRLADPDALSVALMARHAALLHVEHLDERLAIAGELLGLVGERGRPELIALALHWRIFDHLELGDGAAARDDHERLVRVAADLRQPLYRYLARCWEGVWAQLEGRLDEADAISADACAIGERAGARTAGSTRLGALVATRWEQGRLGELVDPVREVIAEHPQITTWRGLLPLVLVEAGRPEEARSALDALDAGGFDRLPRDLFWLTTVTVLGEAAASVGSAGQRAALYHLLAPYADRCVPASLAACWGAVARVLGRLAVALDRRDEGLRHLEDAVRISDGLGAPSAVQRARRDLEAAA